MSNTGLSLGGGGGLEVTERLFQNQTQTMRGAVGAVNSEDYPDTIGDPNLR